MVLFATCMRPRTRAWIAAVVTLASVLVVGAAAVPASAAGAQTQTQVTGPDTATVGVQTTLTASVIPSTADGTVQFSVDGSPVGSAVVVAGGTASLPYTFTSAGMTTVGATFDPANQANFLASSDPDGRSVTVSSPPPPTPTATSTTVTAPSSATVGAPTMLSAAVSPAGAAGAVQFNVDGSPVGSPVPVSDGAASLSYTFPSGGTHRVRAAFTPTDSGAFRASSDSVGLDVSVTAAPTTTEVTEPSSATVGVPTTLSAAVSPAGAAGTVQFSVDGSPVGSPVEVAAGAASLSYTFTSGGAHPVGATFTPTDTTKYAGSTDSDGLTVSPAAAATTIEVTAPHSATAGTATSLGASVRPVAAAGRVTFVVNGARVATVDVVAGEAATSYAFPSAGRPSVLASFEPSDGASYQASVSSSRTVDVEPGATAVAPPELVPTPPVTTTVHGSCTSRASSHGPAYGGARGERLALFSSAPFVFTLSVPGKSLVELLMDLIRFLLDWIMKVFFTVTPCPSGGKDRAARTVQGTAECVRTDTTYTCPLDLPAFSELTISGSVSMPAALAGMKLTLGSALSSVDPVTGELTTLATGQPTVRVPDRTVLSARLAPVQRNLTSVRHGRSVAYRVAVRNAGIVTADRVLTCVSLGKGADVLVAKGAEVRGRRACWTLPSLKKGQTVTRKLTLAAPPKKGPLRIVANLTPKAAQADPVRLIAMLDVR